MVPILRAGHNWPCLQVQVYPIMCEANCGYGKVHVPAGNPHPPSVAFSHVTVKGCQYKDLVTKVEKVDNYCVCTSLMIEVLMTILLLS